MKKKISISQDASETLDTLSKKLGLRRNIVCRLAIGKSLEEKEYSELNKTSSRKGYEFNRYTLTGDLDDIYKAFLVQRKGKELTDEEYVKNLKGHLENGIDLLKKGLEKSSSEYRFLEKLANIQG